MTQVNEYNIKPVTDSDFVQWQQNYTDGNIPENIMKYMLDKITASENKMEVFYNNSINKQ